MASCVTGLVSWTFRISASAVILSPMKTGAVNFQFWLRNTVPGPGMSIATSACKSPVVSPPWTTSLLNFVPATKDSSKWRGLRSPEISGVLHDVILGKRRAAARPLTDLPAPIVHDGSFLGEAADAAPFRKLRYIRSLPGVNAATSKTRRVTQLAPK